MRSALVVGWLAAWTIAFSGVASANPKAVPASLHRIAEANGEARVIVRLAQIAAPEGALTASQRRHQREVIAATQRSLVSDLSGTGFRVTHAYSTIPYLALAVSSSGLDALERLSNVVGVEEDRVFHPILGYDISLVQADQAWAAGSDGSGWDVAILDTGVDGTHPMLAGKVVSESCFSAGNNCPDGSSSDLGPGSAVPCTYASSGCGHGTFVAGIAAGNWPSQGLEGVAKGAGIVAIQIFSRFTGASACSGQEDPCALAYGSDIIAGLERVFVLAPSFKIAAVNLSLGGQEFSTQSACDTANSATKAAIDNLLSVGIATVIASGNDGDASALEEPGCISSAISVGSTNASDQISSFSNSASFLSLLAPGENITSAFPGGQVAIGSGTSAATPHVTGAFAILREKMPSASVTAITNALESTGLPIHDARNGVVTPRIRVSPALAAIASAGSGGITAQLETPVNGGIASGISNVQGWAFTTTPGASIETLVQILIDGAPSIHVPCCSDRADVQQRFSGAPLTTGFAGVFNWGLLTPGTHTLSALVQSTAGESKTLSTTFTSVRVGPASFYSNLQWADASGKDCTTVNNASTPNEALLSCTNLLSTENGGGQVSCATPDRVGFFWDSPSQSFRAYTDCVAP